MGRFRNETTPQTNERMATASTSKRLFRAKSTRARIIAAPPCFVKPGCLRRLVDRIQFPTDCLVPNNWDPQEPASPIRGIDPVTTAQMQHRGRENSGAHVPGEPVETRCYEHAEP